MPKVSVILSSYNQERYIAASIESVLTQTFSDFELLIFDDGSTDGSPKIIRTFDDARIKLFLYEKNRGSYFAVQDLLKIAKGKYVAFHHSDDIWEKTKLEKQVQFLEENPQFEVCFTQVKFIDEFGEIYDLPKNHPYKNVFNQKNRTRAEWLNYLFWNLNCFCNPSMLIRNIKQNFVMTPLLFQLPDYFMWINLCLKKNPYVLQEELIKFRLRRENQSSVSSLTLEKSVRNSNELYITARAFLPLLRDKKFFLEVFPEAEEFLIGGKISAEFAFARLCLKKDLPAYQKLALEILYDLIHNDNKRNLLKKLYGYDEKNFIQDTGKFDVFGIKFQVPLLNCRLYLDFENSAESKAVENCALIRDGGIFSTVFDFQSDKKIKRLRFSPGESAIVSIKIIKITVNGEIIKEYHTNAFQMVEDYFSFLTVNPLFEIDKKFSAEKIHVEILGEVKNDALSNFEKKYSEICATLQEKNSQVQLLESSLQEKNSQVQQLESSLQEKNSQVQLLESSLQEKNSQVQQLESSLQEKISQVQLLENIISAQIEDLKAKVEEINNLQKIQNEILNSNSWKMTKPLRSIGRILRKNKR